MRRTGWCRSYDGEELANSDRSNSGILVLSSTGFWFVPRFANCSKMVQSSTFLTSLPKCLAVSLSVHCSVLVTVTIPTTVSTFIIQPPVVSLLLVTGPPLVDSVQYCTSTGVFM